MGIFDYIVAIIQGIVEGITEWLPISSTGHMILVDEFLKFSNKEFTDMFLVVVQLGAIMAVVLLFWSKIFPFNFKKENGPFIKGDIMMLWVKILVACIPAAVVGILFDDWLDEHLYNAPVVAGALIIYGILFIIIENWNKGKEPKTNSVAELSMKAVFLIGVFQLLAAIFPGTSRSGATIVGALLIGVARPVAAEFTFYLAIPVMAGASLLKMVKYVVKGYEIGGSEIAVLLTGCVVAFIVSVGIIRFLLSYIRKHDFKVFGYYRIVLGILVLLYFFVIK